MQDCKTFDNFLPSQSISIPLHFTERTRILVVEDDADVRFLLRCTLESVGYSVEECTCGEEALITFESATFDLVLLDIMMPGMDGFAVCQALRSKYHSDRLAIVIITGLDDFAAIQQAFDAGATDFITKPVSLQLLKQRVRYILRTRASQLALEKNRSLLAQAHRLARLGSWELDLISGTFSSSENLCHLHGHDACRDESSLRLLAISAHPDDRIRISKALFALEKQHLPFSMSYRIVCPDGEVRMVHHQSEVISNDQEGPLYAIGTVQDISDLHSTELRIQQLAFFDELTGLPNRLGLMQNMRAAVALSQTGQTHLAVISIDIDRFKRINDTLGHRNGDLLLQEFAARLRQASQSVCLRLHDGVQGCVSRPGGDEFVLVLPTLPRAGEAIAVADELLQAIHQQPFTLDGEQIFITASLGISLCPEDSIDTEKLLKNADTAMERARRSGGDQFQFFEQAMNDTAAGHLQLDAELRRALERNELVLYYQPQIELNSGRVCGAEALVRWQHPERGLLGPLEFIPIAEETGLIAPLTKWVLDEACRQLKLWDFPADWPFRMAINLSGHLAVLDQIDALLRHALHVNNLSPSRLEVEITESLMVENRHQTLNLIQGFKALGVSVAIDDFGTGYSSLSYLKSFPVNVLKIDRSFVRDLPGDGNDAAITQAIVAMAYSLNLQVVAEGVETQEQALFLQELGCNFVQGFLFCKPVPAGSFDPAQTWPELVATTALAVGAGR